MTEERQDEPPAELRPVGAFMLLLVHYAAFMTVLWLVRVITQRGEDEDSPGTIRYSMMVFALVVGALMATFLGLVRYAPKEPTIDALRLRRPSWRQLHGLALGVLAGASLAPVSNQIVLALARLWPPSPEAAAVTTPAAPGDELLMAMGVMILVPISLEVLFRGFVQPRLAATIGPARAFLAALILSSLAVVNPLLMPSALLFGVPAGLAAWRTGSTWPAMATSVGYWVTLYFLPESASTLLSAGGVAVAAAACGAMWRFCRPAEVVA